MTNVHKWDIAGKLYAQSAVAVVAKRLIEHLALMVQVTACKWGVSLAKATRSGIRAREGSKL